MKGNKRKKKKKAALFGRILVLLLVLAGGYLAYHWYTDSSGTSDYLPSAGQKSSPEVHTHPDRPLTHTDDISPAAVFMLDGEPMIAAVTRWHKDEQRGMNEINRLLPDSYEMMILDEDINADGNPDYLLIHQDEKLPSLSNFLTDAGYTHVFRDLVVYEEQDQKLVPLLTIGHQAIQNGRGDQLIDQVPAEYGYALLLGTFEHEELYEKPVRLIEIVMIDGEGREASDEITIFWDTSESAYKATNTFGAP